jgi:uncharacterized protein
MSESREKALITGATSGIGKAFAQRLAKHGYDLIITGRRRELLNSLSDELARDCGAKVEMVISELGNDQDVDVLVQKIKNLENLSLLINNAGFGTKEYFHQEDIDGQANMIKVHVMAPVKLMHAVIPNMVKRGKGTIINVSSLRAFAPARSSATYSGTKAFLNIFSESVAAELAGTEVIIQVLCPGFTRTDFHQRIGIQPPEKSTIFTRWMSAEEVVDYSLKNLGKNDVVCIPGFLNKIMAFIPRVVPASLLRKFTPEIGGQKSEE